MRKPLVVCASLFLAALMSASLAQAAQAVVPQQTDVAGSTTKSMSFENVASLKTSATGNYIVKLEGEPLASYQGTVKGLPSTSPRATGDAKLNLKSTAAQSYRSFLQNRREKTLNSISRVLGVQPKVVEVYDVAYNGMALTLTPAQAKQVATMSGVAGVYAEQVYNLQTDAGPGFIGAAQSHHVTVPSLFKSTLNGAGAVPPTSSSATGTAIFTYDLASHTLVYQVRLQNITATNVHIMGGNTSYPLSAALDPSSTSPDFIGSVTIGTTVPGGGTSDEAKLLAGELHISVATASSASEIGGVIAANKGEGILVGSIDSGINFGHKSFASPGEDGYVYTNPLGSGTYVGVCDPTNTYYSADFKCNDKLIGAWTFTLTSQSPGDDGVPSPSDDDGHGSHTASTMAGNAVTASINGIAVGDEDGKLSGVAPHANIISYDVCGYVSNGTISASCPGSALLGAINQATADGVDVINYSIGGGSDDPWNDQAAVAFLIALDNGVLASVSAGNDGPGVETVGSPSNAPWVMSVAASTHDRTYNNTATVGGVDYNGKGFSVALPTPAQLVLSTAYNDTSGNPNSLCLPFADGTDLSGKVVICTRGSNGRVEKADNAKAKGAAGMILTNATASQGLNGDIFPIPAVHITKAKGDALRAALAANAGLTATISGAVKDVSPANGDIVASFSSRGPDASVPTVNKPDIAAPGVDIIAALSNTDTTAGAYEFGTESGTSMAAPHNAGAAALMYVMHPTWTPSEIRSAMMLTAIDTMTDEATGAAATPQDFGAGRVDVRKAAMSGLVLDETAQNFYETEDPTTLNIASLANPACVVSCTWTRTFKNTLNSPVGWTVSSSGAGLSFTATPSTFTIPAGGTQEVVFTVDVQNAALDAYTFGKVVLTPSISLPTVHLPVSVQAKASSLKDLFAVANATSGTVTLSGLEAIAINNLGIKPYGLTAGQIKSVVVPQDSTPSSPIDNLAQVYLEDVEVPDNTARLVFDIIESTSDDLDLYVFDETGSEVCRSATGAVLEYCNIDTPAAGTYMVLIQNYQAANAGGDPVKFASAVVPMSSQGNMTITSSKTNIPAKEPFDLDFAYNLPTNLPGSRWYGAAALSTEANGGTDLGMVRVDLANILTTTPTATATGTVTTTPTTPTATGTVTTTPTTPTATGTVTTTPTTPTATGTVTTTPTTPTATGTVTTTPTTPTATPVTPTPGGGPNSFIYLPLVTR